MSQEHKERLKGRAEQIANIVNESKDGKKPILTAEAEIQRMVAQTYWGMDFIEPAKSEETRQESA